MRQVHDVEKEIDAQVRTFAYRAFAARGTAPRPDEIAAAFGVTVSKAQDVLERLHRAHALFLDPETRAIRMANPFSAVPTAFRVRANGRAYWANCAWDALGIPAALDTDARIEARCAGTDDVVAIEVRAGEVHGNSEVAHFAVPFHRWYDDLVTT